MSSIWKLSSCITDVHSPMFHSMFEDAVGSYKSLCFLFALRVCYFVIRVLGQVLSMWYILLGLDLWLYASFYSTVFIWFVLWLHWNVISCSGDLGWWVQGFLCGMLILLELGPPLDASFVSAIFVWFLARLGGYLYLSWVCSVNFSWIYFSLKSMNESTTSFC